MTERFVIIPIFIPHMGCPNDCTFCNQHTITGIESEVTRSEVEHEIEKYLGYFKRDKKLVQVAYYGGSFTGIGKAKMKYYLDAIRPYINSGIVDSVRVSTRPDYIDEDIIDILLQGGVSTVELGVQSMSDNVLSMNNRGHDSGSVKRSAALIKNANLKFGAQLMTGLYGSTEADELYTANEIIALGPDFVRIYPTLVLGGTELERLFKNGKYNPAGVEECTALLVKLVKLFEAACIDIIRLGLYESGEDRPDIIAGPRHGAIRQLVYGELYYDIIRKFLLDEVGIKYMDIYANSKNLSHVVGYKSTNKIRLQEEFNIKKIRFFTNADTDDVILSFGSNKRFFNLRQYLRTEV